MHVIGEKIRVPIDIAVVLGAQNDCDGTLSDMAVERAEGALREYRNRPGAKLLLTSSYGHFNPAERPHAFYMAEHLLARGVSPNDILPFVDSVNTVEDAAFSCRALRGLPIRRICVVTSAFHLGRARLVFECFFEPKRLEFVGTPDGVAGEDLQRYKHHEIAATNRILSQGGVLFDGRLFAPRAWNAGWP